MRATFFYLLMLQKCHFKAKHSEIEKHPLCLRNISGVFSANKIKKNKNKKKQDEMSACTIFLLVIRLLILVILPTFINI